MNKVIVSRNSEEFQLVGSVSIGNIIKLGSLGTELVNTVFALLYCKPELENNIHMIKANECAKKWNDIFFKAFELTKEGVK